MMRAGVGSGGNVGASRGTAAPESAGGAGYCNAKEDKAMRYTFGDYALATERHELQGAGAPRG
jgi:hypothetical protein